MQTTFFFFFFFFLGGGGVLEYDLLRQFLCVFFKLVFDCTMN